MRFWIALCRPASEELTNQDCDIVFEHVGFSYQSGETVLKNVSFMAKQGQVTALVGPSGGGKTTISRLAARFWDIDRGRITVGGMDVSKIDPEKLMSLYSIVFQDVTLFDNSILEKYPHWPKGGHGRRGDRGGKVRQCGQIRRKAPLTVGIPTSVKTAASCPAASGSAFPLPVPS